MKIKLYGEKVKIKNGVLFDPATNEPLDPDYYDIKDVWHTIGLKLSQWWGGQADPIYAISYILRTGNLFHDEPRLYYLAKLNLPPKLGNKYWEALPPKIRVAAVTQFWADDIRKYGYKALINDIKQIAQSDNLFYDFHQTEKIINGWNTIFIYHTFANVIVYDYKWAFGTQIEPQNINLKTGEIYK